MLCACGNSARYIDERGALTCALCPLKAGLDSIRFADVPALLAWARMVSALAEGRPDIRVGNTAVAHVMSIIGRRP